MKWRVTGRAENMLRQYIKPARAHHCTVLLAGGDAFPRRFAFEHFKAIRRHQQSGRSLVKTVIGATDTLRQTARAFWRADMNDQINRAPINTQIKR